MGKKFLFGLILYLVGKCKQVLFNCFSKLPARQSPFASASISPKLFKLNVVTQLSHPSESEWHSRLEEYLCIHLHWFAQIHKLMNTKFNLAFEKGYEKQISHGLYQTLWNNYALIHSEVLNWFQIFYDENALSSYETILKHHHQVQSFFF